MADEEISRLADMLQGAEQVSFFTGAGVSTESGIADFRSPGGIWSKIKPIQFANFVESEDVRLEDWRRRFHFQTEFDSATPNAGHRAMAKVVNSTKGGKIVTQNIDGLHQRAGVAEDDIIEIHGNGTHAACLDCQLPMALPDIRKVIDATGKPPNCESCGGLMKSAVISFGQAMPQDKMLAAMEAAKTSDLFIVAGSSLVVQPAAQLPVVAKESGAQVVIINRDSTPCDSLADLVMHRSIGEVLGQAVAEMTP